MHKTITFVITHLPRVEKRQGEHPSRNVLKGSRARRDDMMAEREEGTARARRGVRSQEFIRAITGGLPATRQVRLPC
ncbi:hypothetical protein NDU88_010214 [Pleurodeles waltl]|uniref:Uncharacterized protein n=1 Tax=Pleurodeles waltl TaxID=8319 RepID=A0AAV7S3A3_PLEWA|nr:hypothetical protein NDU88_010214 [Pleurodeles waltl]